MHLVHKDADNNLAVIGIFLVDGEGTWALPSGADGPLDPGECFATDDTIDLNALYQTVIVEPEAAPAFYQGSLTTPPCSEGVSWILVDAPLELSEADFQQLESAYMGNNRDTQPLNDRTILVD